jgi:ferric-dicitrate binding protein FerR (iron transport regulator)
MKTVPYRRAADMNVTSGGKGMLRRRLCFSRHLLLAGILAGGFAASQSAIGAPSPVVARATAAGIRGGNVELNGARMASGAALFPGDVVTLGEASLAALQFGRNQVLAAPQTELVVEADGVSLRKGSLQIRANDGNTFRVAGPFFRVSVGASRGAASSAEIRVAGKRAQVSATSGVADLAAAGNAASYELHAGEMATLNAAGEVAAGGDASAGADDASTPAGQVSRLLPQVQIDRASKELSASLSSPVYWNDDLHSGATGRARIALQDGSLLNLGSNSSLRVLQHDAAAQQTSLDFAIGRMRGQVVKLTRPGAKFEVRTPAGVAGLVGTDFSLWVTRDSTELIVFDGAVRFTPLSNGQAVTVSAGMKLLISSAGTLAGPLPATPKEILTAKELTDVPDPPQQAARTRIKPIVPVLVTLSVAGAVTGIGTWLAAQEPGPVVSPVIP